MTNLVPICCDGIDIKYRKKETKKKGKRAKKRAKLLLLVSLDCITFIPSSAPGFLPAFGSHGPTGAVKRS